ncbi:MAG: 23S rRNA (adenine(2503)-C(2))-methyltransferase RlmN, partial [Anaerovoracaceae bacterium]
METEKTHLKNMTLSEMQEWFLHLGEKKFRALQVFRRIYGGAASFDEMTELSSKLRSRLEETAVIDSVRLLKKQESRKDGTRKYLFEVEGGSAIESVFMRYRYGNTACISSQAGCRMGCVFCASGVSGLERNLTAGEIADQVAAMSRDTGERIGHIVVMGTGEPFDNYDELLRAIRILHDENGLNIGLRNITVSTCGLLSKIQRFAEDMPQVNLAVSLHAADDETRRKLMPVAAGYDMRRLMEVCRRTAERTHRRITFEYALISG